MVLLSPAFMQYQLGPGDHSWKHELQAREEMLHILAKVVVRANMVPFMDVNNMNEYEMVSPDSKGAGNAGDCSALCLLGRKPAHGCWACALHPGVKTGYRPFNGIQVKTKTGGHKL